MSGLPGLLALLLLTNLLVALVQVVRGPTAADRLLVVLLFGTTGVALLLLLAYTTPDRALVDVALAVALLAAITGAAFSERAWRAPRPGKTQHERDRMGE